MASKGFKLPALSVVKRRANAKDIHYMNQNSANAGKAAKKAPRPAIAQNEQREIQESPVKEPGFFAFIWRHPANRIYLLAALAINIVLFLFYKYYHPLPDFYSDSQGYILAAAENKRVFYRPFGYARFLQRLHNFTDDHYTIVAVQYCMAVIASLFCYFSVDYLFRFQNKKIKFISWLLVTVNPLLLALSNMILSDILFTALSVVWFTLLLWVIKKKQWWSLIAQVVILYLVFQVRYNALYYPVLCSIVLLLSPGMKVYYRLSGVAASFIVIFALYNGIRNETAQATGADVFAGFSGWQMANNALYIYKHTDIKSSDFEENDQRLLNEFVKFFIDSMPAIDKQGIEQGVPGAAFLWAPKSPLKQYVTYHYKKYRSSYFRSWYQVSEMYGDYGKRIITKYPYAYFRWYILGNLRFFMVPMAETLETYNVGDTKLTPLTRQWLRIKEDKLYTRSPSLQRTVMSPYPWLHAVLFVFGLLMPALYLFRAKKRQGKWRGSFVMPVLFWYLFLLAGMAFSVIAAVVCLRYEAVLFVISFTLPLYFLDQFISMRKKAIAG